MLTTASSLSNETHWTVNIDWLSEWVSESRDVSVQWHEIDFDGATGWTKRNPCERKRKKERTQWKLASERDNRRREDHKAEWVWKNSSFNATQITCTGTRNLQEEKMTQVVEQWYWAQAKVTWVHMMPLFNDSSSFSSLSLSLSLFSFFLSPVHVYVSLSYLVSLCYTHTDTFLSSIHSMTVYCSLVTNELSFLSLSLSFFLSCLLSFFLSFSFPPSSMECECSMNVLRTPSIN